MRDLLALSPAARLLALTPDVVDAADAGRVAALALCLPPAAAVSPGPGIVVADPLRLPFVEALFDRIVADLSGDAATPAALRELRRIAAPGAVVVLTAPRRPRLAGLFLSRRGLSRAELRRRLLAAGFHVLDWRVVAGRHVVSVAPGGGGVAVPVHARSRRATVVASI